MSKASKYIFKNHDHQISCFNHGYKRSMIKLNLSVNCICADLNYKSAYKGDLVKHISSVNHKRNLALISSSEKNNIKKFIEKRNKNTYNGDDAEKDALQSLDVDNEGDNAIDLLESISAKVQRVHIEGLDRTKEDVVIGSVHDVFGASDFQSIILEVHKARMKLGNLGCFKNVDVFLDTYNGDDAEKDALQVTFKVKELRLLGASVNTSIGNNEGSVTTGAILRNILGRGESLNSQCSYGTKKSSNFSTTFNKPFHNEAKTEVSTTVYQEATEAPWSGFKELDRGFLLSLGFTSAPSVKQKLILDGAWRQLSCLSRSTAFAVREQSGHSLKSSLRHELIVDKRDESIFPTDGISFIIKNELAGLGGDIGFLKNQMDLQVNLPLFNDMVIQGTLQAGHMLPLRNNKTHCITDRFILGGPTSIRGFEMAGVGPHSEGYSLGAEMFWAAAIHCYSPLPFLDRGGSFSERFRLHAFVNTGNIGDFNFTEDQRKNVQMLIKDMRLSYGAGLAMNLAGIARVELNYCIPLFLQRGDRPSQGLQFGVSTNFL